MKPHILLALLAVCLCTGASGAEAPTRKNTDANLFGHVVDRDTHEHIPYATVAVQGTTFGTTTDASGHYFLKNLPEGGLTVEVRALGYAPQQVTVTMRRGESLEQNFEVVQSGISMDEVVVSASRSATLRREAPALVSVLDADLFARSNAACLAQGLSFQPGVRVEDNCQNCGFTQVRINGLDGHYSQILVDSHPVFSALTGVYGLEQIPANMIERVEVLRGGGSALFGSSAIGGTINIITREPTRNSAQLSHTLTSLGGSNSYDNNTMLNASLVSESGRAGLCVFGQSRHRSGYDHNGDGFTELPVIESSSVGMRSYFRTGAYSRITAQYHHIGEYRRGGDRLNRPPHEALIAEQVDHAIDGGSLSFDASSADRSNRVNAYVSFQNTARKSYYGSKQDADAYGGCENVRLDNLPDNGIGGRVYRRDVLYHEVAALDVHDVYGVAFVLVDFVYYRLVDVSEYDMVSGLFQYCSDEASSDVSGSELNGLFHKFKIFSMVCLSAFRTGGAYVHKRTKIQKNMLCSK